MDIVKAKRILVESYTRKSWISQSYTTKAAGKENYD